MYSAAGARACACIYRNLHTYEVASLANRGFRTSTNIDQYYLPLSVPLLFAFSAQVSSHVVTRLPAFAFFSFFSFLAARAFFLLPNHALIRAFFFAIECLIRAFVFWTACLIRALAFLIRASLFFFAAARAFERFYSFRSEDCGKGNGLGLTFVQEVADLHQGKARIFRREEGGTEARMELPIIPAST